MLALLATAAIGPRGAGGIAAPPPAERSLERLRAHGDPDVLRRALNSTGSHRHSRLWLLGLGCCPQSLGNWAQPNLAQRPLPPWR